MGKAKAGAVGGESPACHVVEQAPGECGQAQVGGQPGQHGGVDRFGLDVVGMLGREERLPDCPARGTGLQ